MWPIPDIQFHNVISTVKDYLTCESLLLSKGTHLLDPEIKDRCNGFV